MIIVKGVKFVVQIVEIKVAEFVELILRARRGACICVHVSSTFPAAPNGRL
jgi:hypothetical protein